LRCSKSDARARAVQETRSATGFSSHSFFGSGGLILGKNPNGGGKDPGDGTC
jgi:hypothetical protein